MANRTIKDAQSVRGTNPQYLIEKIIRTRIYDSKYWKEECFALSAELVVDKAMELRFIGGVHGGNIKPTQFLCLLLKLLQIQPEKDIVVEFIKNEEFKYVRALGAMYMRLVGTSLDCYKYLEPLFNDNRKLRRQNRSGNFELLHMDEFVNELLNEDRVCDIMLPRIQKRWVLEENNELDTKISALDDDLDEGMESFSDEEFSSKQDVGRSFVDGNKFDKKRRSRPNYRERTPERKRHDKDKHYYSSYRDKSSREQKSSLKTRNFNDSDEYRSRKDVETKRVDRDTVKAKEYTSKYRKSDRDRCRDKEFRHRRLRERS